MSWMAKSVKTNAIRILEKSKVVYELIEYDIEDGVLDGVAVAAKTGQSEETVFKTLVTLVSQHELVVFLIPVAQELDMKKAAKAAGVKRLEMLPLKDLTIKTGYVRGGCSAIGMKKSYPTIIDNSALQLEQMIVSAGKPGLQMKLKPNELARCTDAIFHDVVKDS